MFRRTARLAALTGVAAVAVPAGAARATTSPVVPDADTAAVTTALAGRRDHHLHGRLLHAAPLAKSLWPRGTAAAYRVTYLSSGVDGRLTVVTGSVFVPSAAYRGSDAGSGRPVIGWAHDTTGIADNCAPSRGGNPSPSQAAIAGWLGQGYVVAETDYQGLGTPGRHPFLIGRSEAHGVVDIVRATRQLRGVHVSRKWLVAGHSQGGQAALFVGSMAKEYGRELDFRGTVATAPISQWRMTIDQVAPFRPKAPGNPFLPMIVSGIDAVQPDLVDEQAVFTPKGREIYRRARTNLCYYPLAEIVQTEPGTAYYHLDDATVARLVRALEKYAEIPIAKYERPVFIAQGTADTTVYPPASRVTATKLGRAGTDTTFRSYPGATHESLEEASLADALAWARQRLAS